jgi:hypothetical protein
VGEEQCAVGVCDSGARSTLSPKIEKPRKSVFGDIVLCGLIVAVVQATDPRVSNNATPSC